jgi:hypothetical protein
MLFSFVVGFLYGKSKAERTEERRIIKETKARKDSVVQERYLKMHPNKTVAELLENLKGDKG